MRFQLALLLTMCISTVVYAISIPFQDMTDVQIANYIVQSSTQNTQKDILYPTPNEVWYVGEKVNVTFTTESSASGNQTVSIFFFNKSGTLAGGPLVAPKTTFDFVVPSDAKSPANSTSLLLAIRRQNRYLQTVNSVDVHVI